MTPRNKQVRPRRTGTERLGAAVYDKVFSMILSGELRAGEPLQERRIAALLGVSRSPVREAVKRLDAEGLIEGSGRLQTVRQVNPNEALEIISIRLMFEPKCAALAAARPDAERLVALIADLDALAGSENPTAREHWTLDDRIHAAVVEIAGFRVLRAILEELRMKTRMFNKNAIPERFLPGCREHRDILTAILSGNARAAEEAMTLHLTNTSKGIVHRLQSGRPPIPG